MINNIIDKNVVFLQNHGIKMNNDDNRAVYKYGLQILYYYIIDVFVIFSLAHCFSRLYETIIMTFIFGVLQVFGGGYHAKTPGKCLATMMSGVSVGNFLIMLMMDNVNINYILVIILSVILLLLSPVTNKKHMVSKKVKCRSKFIVRIAVVLLLIVSTVCFYLSRRTEIAVVLITLVLYMLSWLATKIKLKGKT